MVSRPFLPISKHITGFESQLAVVWLVVVESHTLSHSTLGLAYVLANDL